MPFYGDVQAELDAVDARQTAMEMARRQAQSTNAAQISRANQIQRNYKWLPPGASMAFAKGGIDDDTIQRIASTALTNKSQNTALGLNQPGDVVDAATEARRLRTEWIKNHEAGISKAVQPIADVAHKVGGAVLGATATGDNPLARGLRTVSRNTMAVMDAPRQLIQGSYRTVSEDIQKHGLFGSIEDTNAEYQAGTLNTGTLPGQLDIGQTLKSLVHGRRVDQGSGFFVNPDSGVGQARQAEEAKFGQMRYADGSMHNRSIGRDFASMFTEPGSRGFQVLSGATDAGVAIGADLPGNQITQGLKAAHQFQAIGEGIEYADDVSRIRKARDAAGLIFNPGSRATYSPEVMEGWLGTSTGINTVTKLAGSDEREIFKMAPKMPADMVRALARAETPEEVRTVLRAGLGRGAEALPTTKLGQYGVTAKSHMPDVYKRWVNRLPSDVWPDLDNADELLTSFDRELDAMNMPGDRQAFHFNAMAEHPDALTEEGKTMTRNLRAKAIWAARDETVDHIVWKQSDLTGLEGIDPFTVDIHKGTYLSDIGIEQPLSSEQKAKINQIRENQRRVREIFNPSKQGRLHDQVINNMLEDGSNASIWQATYAGGRNFDPEAIGMAWKNSLDEDVRGAVNNYSGMGYIHDERWSAENVGRTLDNPTAHAALQKHLADSGIPETVTVYRGSEAGATATGKYINASLDPTQAGFYAGPDGDLVKMTVPRSSIVGFGNTAEHEVLIRADEAGKAERVAFDALRAEEDAYRMGDGKIVLGDAPDPWLLSEFHGRFLPTPDWNAVHKELSSIGPMLNAQGNVISTQWAHNVQEKIWKPLVVFRSAAMLRIVGETQAGMYAAGLDNIASNPLNTMSLLLADTKLGERFGLKRGLRNGVLGDEVDDADGIKRALNVSSMYSTAKAEKHLPEGMVRIDRGERPYHEALTFEIELLRKETSDPLPRMIADALAKNESLDTIKERFWAMEDYRRDLQEIAPFRRLQDGVEPMMDRNFTDAYVEGTADRIRLKTGMDPTLLDEIIDPKMNRDEILAHIKTLDQDALPAMVKGPKALTAAQEKSRREVVDRLFGALIRKPVHLMSESPAVRQAYWREVKRLAPLVDPEHADELLAQAAKAGLNKGEMRQLEYFARREVPGAAEGGVRNALNLEQVNELGQTKSVQMLQRLFEDHVSKRRFIDAIGLVSPFAHVWAESLGRWSKFLAEDPTLMHNLQYAFNAARNPDVAKATVGSFMGVPEGRGFLYPDTDGKERFAYPMSAQMMKAVSGVDAPLTGSLQGLSLGFDILPGVGPIMSIPIAQTIPKTPEWDGVRDVVFPYGQPKSLLDLRTQLPPWLQRVGAGVGVPGMEDERSMAATTMDIMRVKLAEGGYDIHNADPQIADAENKRLLSESRKAATWFTVMRGVAGFTSPSAPAPEWWLEDKTGKRIMLQSLTDDYQKMYTEDPQNAVTNFMDRYGDNAMLAIQGKTVSVALGGGMPPTKQAEQWTRGAAKGIDKDLPLAYGFFAPRGDDDKLDFTVYDRQIASGERAALTPEQMLQESNRRVAQTIYYTARNELPTNLSVKQSALMRGLREDLEKRYPGYESKFGEDIVGVPNKASVGQTIDQLIKATGDDRLADNAATSTLIDYLKIRDHVRAESAGKLGNADTWATSKKGAKARAALWEVGNRMAQTNKAFAPMWESVLYREFQSEFETDQGVK